MAYLPRYVVEKIFDSNEYDKMYVVDMIDNILYAKSKNDGVLIDRNLNPSDEKIKYFNIYGSPSPSKYSYLLITSREGEFDIKWFKLEYKEYLKNN